MSSTNGLYISGSFVKITSVDLSFKAISYETYQYSAVTRQFEKKPGNHRIPHSSNIDISFFKEKQSYFLNSFRLPSERGSPVWHIASATNVETGEVIKDMSVLQYTNKLFFGQ